MISKVVEFVSGNLFDCSADIRVNTVNCVGVMGAGVALAFRERYPEMYREYRRLCAKQILRPGGLFVWKTLFGEWVVNVATKDHWRDPSQFPWVEECLRGLRKYLEPEGPVRVVLPALGCGHGGLKWHEVKPLVMKYLDPIEAQVYVYPPISSRQIRRG